MNKPMIVGVAGGTGSGKTTVVTELVKWIGPNDIGIIQHDNYYKDRSHLSPREREKINYDHPDALETSLLCHHLNQLQKWMEVNIPIYDFVTHTRKDKTRNFKPEKVIIVEGILIFVMPVLREIMDLRIFVDTDDDVRFIRRLYRDIGERGRTMNSVIQQYLNTVKPMYHQFVEPCKKHADLIIPEGGFNQIAIDVLATRIKSFTSSGLKLPNREILAGILE